MVFFRDSVESPKVHTEAKCFVFLFDEEYRSSVRRCKLPNELREEVFVDEVSKSFELGGRQRVEAFECEQLFVF